MALVRPGGTFISTVLGYPVALSPTDILDDDHPHVVAQPDSFVPVTATVPHPGRDDTAAGVQRARRRA